MKMSPMQKYAMRLLIAGGRIRVPDQNSWATMTADRADEQLRRLGGMEAVLQKTVLPNGSRFAENGSTAALFSGTQITKFGFLSRSFFDSEKIRF